jgi:hypothetical protein
LNIVSYEARTVSPAVNPIIPAPVNARRSEPVAVPASEPSNALGDLFAIALQRCRPTSVAMLRGEDGRLRVRRAAWDEQSKRFEARFSMDLRMTDLTEDVVAFEPVNMVHAALVLEQAPEASRYLDNLAQLVESDGYLSIVLESQTHAPAQVSRGLAPTAVGIKQTSFISPIWLMDAMEKRGFTLVQDRRRSASGTGFWLGVFKRNA